MSYLSGTRLHFAGAFQAAVSTVNNDPTHFDTKNFDPSWWKFTVGNDANGWWNPPGDAVWRLIGCEITAAFVGDDQPVAPTDPIFTCSVADSDGAAPAKLVDLDTEQQMVSTIFGLAVRIAAPDGETLAGGAFEPAPFTNIWQRCPGRGDGVASAVYQSVLTGVEWPNTAGSAFLEALQAATSDGLLSICFTVDGYRDDHTTSAFTTGRIVGTIGPATAAEPHQLLLGRQFVTTNASGGFFLPAGKLNFCTAVVDGDAGTVRIDLGNALPTASSGGRLVDLGPLALTCPSATGDVVLGRVEGYAAPGWYEQTAGVVALPVDAAQLDHAAEAPLTLASVAPDPTGAIISEAADGLHVRADQFVFRLEPEDAPIASVYATRFGNLAPGVAIDVALDLDAVAPAPDWPPTSTPTTALTFDSPITTGPDGIASLTLTGADPGNPRGYIDGQIYAVRPVPAGAPADAVVNPSDFISVLLFSGWQPDDPITWNGSLQPIFLQFYTLYPVMARFLDLSDYQSVSANVLPLTLAFGLPIEDPNTMPVTRDLSAAKRAAILSWLQSPGPDGKPLLGEGPPPGRYVQEATVDAGARVTAGAAAGDGPVAVKSGKQGFLENQSRGRTSS
jgi:hypothetical protein